MSSAGASTSSPPTMEAPSTIHVPRVAIRFCTRCKWNLRAAYYAQELLQTFEAAIGEISLIPVTGGIFDITLYHAHKPPTASTINGGGANVKQDSSQPGSEAVSGSGTTTGSASDLSTPVMMTMLSSGSETTMQAQPPIAVQSTLIWERNRDGGFPETKELKNRIRNVIDPQRDMGHIDRSLKKKIANNDAPDTKGADGSVIADETKSTKDVKSDTQKSRAAGDESLQFGSNVEPAAGVEILQDTKDQAKDCEDCK